VAYLGAQIIRHWGPGIRIQSVNSGSPAASAGLQEDDLILEVENQKFYGQDLDVAEFARFVRALPAGRPLRFLISRNGVRLERQIALEEREASPPESRQRTRPAPGGAGAASVEAGLALMKQGKFPQAIEIFKNTAAQDPRQSNELMGVCYFEMNDIKTAQDMFTCVLKSYNNSPVSLFYMGLCSEKNNNEPIARHYYRAFLGMRYPDQAMNNYASERLGALDAKWGKEAGDKLMDIINELKKEMPQ
jgi:TolA-binding protein